jgi:DNA-3-methyladenine glycosylase I
MSSYCDAAPGHEFHGPYHDSEYGFPVNDEAVLFERMTLEMAQAGLSWLTILKKRDGYRKAFRGFDIDKVARFGARDRARLLTDARIIRNRLKIDATIENAKRVRALRASHGGLYDWIAAHHPMDKADWVKLFRGQFKFMGGEIVGEFLMSIGYLPGAHRETCPVYEKIAKLSPPWMAAT